MKTTNTQQNGYQIENGIELNESQERILERICEYDIVIDRDLMQELYGSLRPSEQRIFMRNCRVLVKHEFIKSINPRQNNYENFNFGIKLKALPRGKNYILNIKLKRNLVENFEITNLSIPELFLKLKDYKDLIIKLDKRISDLERTADILINK